MRSISWWLVILLLAPLTVLAQDPPPTQTVAPAQEAAPTRVAFTEGKALFEAGEYAQAIDKLQQACREEPENLDASFYLGRSAFETGDYEAAIVAFERILIVEPDAQRVKLELARAYLKLGSRDIARAYFKSVQATNPPPAVWQQIQLFIDSIDAAEQKNLFNGFVTMGVFYDDNAGAATSRDSVDVILPNGDSFPVSTQKVEHDAGLQATAVVNHIYRFIDTPYVWKSTLTTYNNFYDDLSKYNLNYYALNTGLVHQDDTSLSELQGMVGHVDYGSDRYLGLLGVNLNHTRFLIRHLQLSLGASFQKQEYYQDENSQRTDKDGDRKDRDALVYGLSVNPVLNVDGNRLSLNLAGEWGDAEHKSYDYRRTTAGLRYDRQLPMDFAAFAGFRHQWTDYRGDEPFFAKKRADRQLVWDIGLSKVLWRSVDQKRLLAAQISYSHTDNNSNVDLYEYDKDMTLTTLTFAF